MTSFCKFVKLSAGVTGAFVQFALDKSEFSCSTKSIEGTSQARRRLLSERVMFSVGVGSDCEIQIPPPLTTATNLLPSAEEATANASGTLFELQVAPESLEV